jgi:hypothetical protein
MEKLGSDSNKLCKDSPTLIIEFISGGLEIMKIISSCLHEILCADESNLVPKDMCLVTIIFFINDFCLHARQR